MLVRIVQMLTKMVQLYSEDNVVRDGTAEYVVSSQLALRE